MTHPSKVKGNTYEREIVNESKMRGFESKRAYASDGRSLGFHETVDLLIEEKKIQAKRRKSIAAFMKPTEHVDAVMIREDRGKTLVVITLDEYYTLLSQREN
jgi:Holliday junction resolvase